jgi:hypothetical protein
VVTLVRLARQRGLAGQPNRARRFALVRELVFVFVHDRRPAQASSTSTFARDIDRSYRCSIPAWGGVGCPTASTPQVLD